MPLSGPAVARSLPSGLAARTPAPAPVSRVAVAIPAIRGVREGCFFGGSGRPAGSREAVLADGLMSLILLVDFPRGGVWGANSRRSSAVSVGKTSGKQLAQMDLPETRYALPLAKSAPPIREAHRMQ